MQKSNKPIDYEWDCHVGAFKGRILKVKQGYNPNSSSLGSIVFSLPVMLMGISTLFGFAASILFAAANHHNGRHYLKALPPEIDTEMDKKRSEGESL